MGRLPPIPPLTLRKETWRAKNQLLPPLKGVKHLLKPPRPLRRRQSRKWKRNRAPMLRRLLTPKPRLLMSLLARMDRPPNRRQKCQPQRARRRRELLLRNNQKSLRAMKQHRPKGNLTRMESHRQMSSPPQRPPHRARKRSPIKLLRNPRLLSPCGWSFRNFSSIDRVSFLVDTNVFEVSLEIETRGVPWLAKVSTPRRSWSTTPKR